MSHQRINFDFFCFKNEKWSDGGRLFVPMYHCSERRCVQVKPECALSAFN
jgi:hypothetical protein